MFLLETDTLVNLLRGTSRVMENINAHRAAPKFFSVISYGELVHGCRKSQRVDHNLYKIQLLVEYYKIIDVTVPIMDCFGEVKATLQRAGTPVEDMDLIIACTALAMNYTLVTNNTKHFQKIPGLKLVNWS